MWRDGRWFDGSHLFRSVLYVDAVSKDYDDKATSGSRGEADNASDRPGDTSNLDWIYA